jgi:hypothetical protein
MSKCGYCSAYAPDEEGGILKVDNFITQVKGRVGLFGWNSYSARRARERTL